MEFSIKVLVGITLAVITFLVILGIMGGVTGNANDQLGGFFKFMGEVKPPSIGG